MSDIDRQLDAIRAIAKFRDGDRDYLSRRKKFAEDLGFPDLYAFIDQFALYAGEQTLATRLATYEILKQTLDVPGHIVEFGVWHGANLMFLAKTLRLLQPNTAKLLFGFDNFAGLPAASGADGARAAGTQGAYRGNEQVLRAAIELYGLDDWVHLIKGDALETIPAFEEKFPEVLVSLAWLDFDLYEPTKAALRFLARRLAVGGIVVFDEALSSAWPGETLALREFLEDCASGRFEMGANRIGRQPVLYLVKRP
jgi:SAM-dependent methyltransferase